MISIITPFYNTTQYLTEFLSSIIKQKYTDWELLLIDDGSTDDSPNMAKKAAAHDRRIRYIHTKHVGFALAKNIGLDNAKGDLIAFADSDDLARPDWLSGLYQLMQATNADIVSCNFQNFELLIPNRSISSVSYRIFDKDRFASLSPITTFAWNKLYRRKVWEGIRHPDVTSLSDTAVLFKVMRNANYIAHLYVPLYLYRRHIDSISGRSQPTTEYFSHRLDLLTDNYLLAYEFNPIMVNNLLLLFDQEVKKIPAKLNFDPTPWKEKLKPLYDHITQYTYHN